LYQSLPGCLFNGESSRIALQNARSVRAEHCAPLGKRQRPEPARAPATRRWQSKGQSHDHRTLGNEFLSTPYGGRSILAGRDRPRQRALCGDLDRYSGTLGDNSEIPIHRPGVRCKRNKAGAEFLINTLTPDEQSTPAINRLPTDVSLSLQHSNGTSFNVRAQIFNVDGSKSASEFLSTHDRAQSVEPTIATLATGFCRGVGRHSAATLTFAPDLQFQRHEVGREFTVAGADSQGLSPSRTDRRPFAWRGLLQVESRVGLAVAEIFNSNGTKWGFELPSIPRRWRSDTPAMTALADGRFVIAWTDNSQTGGDVSERAVRAQSQLRRQQVGLSAWSTQPRSLPVRPNYRNPE